ncbi:looped-hinge helix DNA binding domain-containing protein, AbrB family [Acetitomaculum ruminis DSM 5522]|uniref:Looped-hinge helix DNA binding domain-containing protein, AbrB family n=1 Tax=Acetitomaculum ruminis DSM 5522 TaxID=1120918 RepID=A0A1I1A2A7_9FIRM|nr:helix-turn-helix domain-containing protein [Acetitomaculum ruminis]SFB30710.1 looped-hinge helix DNA binding domain-containing protein, AbrB family [Acetitomaculum ruminis DSM 5522]
MLKENLMMLRSLHGYSQEEIAEQIGISRQAYAKWESGATIPDIEKCNRLAKVYHTSIDSLIKTTKEEGIGMIPPAPAGKNIWGSVTINDRGQIVIPKGAREKFNLKGGGRLVVLSDEQGIALIPAESFEAGLKKVMESMLVDSDKER